MAELPPRKNPTPTKILTQSLSPLETLLQMGFTKLRAEKALVATGHKGAQLAADWLLAHVKDPRIDQSEARDFIIYLCPVGELKEQLSLFWQKSRLKFGWNGAHNSLPHITLTSSFKCSDQDVAALLKVIAQVCESFLGSELARMKLSLERYMSPNFFGLFVKKEDEHILRQLSADLCQEIRKLGLNSDPILKSFHLTLAYQFQQKHFQGLEELAEAINPLSDCSWQLRLYSYDSYTDGHEVYKVLYAHVPREPDELELVIGDFVFVTPEEMANSTDGWVLGISWLTGCTGYLPANYVERTAETNAWTQHSVVPLLMSGQLDSQSSTSNIHHQTEDSLSVKSMSADLMNSSSGSSPGDVSRLLANNNSPGDGVRLINSTTTAECDSSSSRMSAADLEVETLFSSAHQMADKSGGSSGRESPQGVFDPGHERSLVSSTTPPGYCGAPRQLYIVRHGERVDFTFGIWIPFSFDCQDKYVKKDLNMPGSLPERSLGPHGFARDCPLTVIGSLQARMVGEAMREAQVSIQHVFCSPSLRCVQTCHNILLGLGIADRIKINLEPGLFEWCAWYQDGMPDWMTASELRNAGYNIDCSYKPYISADELQDTQESCQQFYIRNFFVTQCALQATEEMGGNVLFVGHAATVDTCSRQLVKKDPRSVNELMSIVRKASYCCVAAVEEIIPEEEDLSSGLESPTPSSRCGGSLLSGRAGSPGGLSSVSSIMSRSTARTVIPAPPPPRSWRLIEPPFPPLTHTATPTFDWKILLDRQDQKKC